MPRQPTLSPENMRALFIRCAEEAIREEGLKHATARNIAARAGYTAGTLYTCFRNLDDLLIQLQIVVLERLRDRLIETRRSASGPDSGTEQVTAITRAYLQFAFANPELWSLIQQDGVHEHPDLADRFAEALKAIRDIFTNAPIAQARTNGKGHADADLLWASVHGLTGVLISKKLGVFNPDTAEHMATSLATYLHA